MQVQLVDCLVQGADAPPQIINRIEFFNQSARPPEVLVLIRGGGSADDLEAFSAEQVVRAVASSRVPTLVAIGHERDVSLAELAADRHASTPSNAAEMLTPDKTSEKDMLHISNSRLKQAMKRMMKDESEDIFACKENLDDAISRRLEREQQMNRQRANFLRALDPSAPLKRGFALVKDEKGKIVRSIKPVDVDDKLSVNLSDGSVDVKVLNKRGKNG